MITGTSTTLSTCTPAAARSLPLHDHRNVDDLVDVHPRSYKNNLVQELHLWDLPICSRRGATPSMNWIRGTSTLDSTPASNLTPPAPPRPLKKFRRPRPAAAAAKVSTVAQALLNTETESACLRRLTSHPLSNSAQSIDSGPKHTAMYSMIRQPRQHTTHNTHTTGTPRYTQTV